MSTTSKPKSTLIIRRLTVIIIIALVLLHITTWVISSLFPDNRILVDIYGRFGMDSELSLPTWFTSMLWFSFSFLCFAIARVQKKARAKNAWAVLSIVGLLASIDEVIALHELILQGLHILADFGEGQTIFANAWLLVLPALAVVALFLFRTIRQGLPKDTQKSLFIGFVVFLLGAFIIEYVSIPFDKSLAIYSLGVVIVEEALEIFGVGLVISAVVQHIANYESKLQERLKGFIS